MAQEIETLQDLLEWLVVTARKYGMERNIAQNGENIIETRAHYIISLIKPCKFFHV